MAEEIDLKEAVKPKGEKLVRPDIKATSFTANGKVYRIHESVSFDRYQYYELLQVEIGLARTFAQLQEQINEAVKLFNQLMAKEQVAIDLAVLLRDLQIGTMLVGEKQTHAVLKMACLFINREGEDVRYIDEALIDSKIDDWRTEGIDMAYFFQFALLSIPGFFDAYKAISQGISTRDLEGRRREGASTSKNGDRQYAEGTTASSPP